MQSIPGDSLPIDYKVRVDLRPVHIRTLDFDEVVIKFSVERVMFEAVRCLHCPDPVPCMVRAVRQTGQSMSI